MSAGPLIVQSDKTLLLEVDHPDAQACRMAIAPFAELERSPEHVHTYRLTPLGLWNARAAGHDAESVVDSLIKFSRYPVPHALLVDVADTMDRYGRLQLVNDPQHGLVLRGLDKFVLVEVAKSKKLAGMLGARIDDETIAVHGSERGRLKQALLKLGWPAEDLAGYVDGEAHAIALAEVVKRLRAGERLAAAVTSSTSRVTQQVPRVTSASILELLRTAVREELQIAIGYVDDTGTPSQRILLPISLGGGMIRGHDPEDGRLRSYPLQRITTVSMLDEPG